MEFTPSYLRVYLIPPIQNTPRVSVVMAVYNKAPYLRQSIGSVLNQDMGDLELICVDAASTDGSLQILKDYAARDPRIKVFSTTYSRIPAATKNYGIDRTTGEYVFNLDADDYLQSDTLGKMVDRLQETDADAIVPDLQTVSETGENQPPYISGVKGDRNILLSNRQAVTESLDWTIHGFALWKGDLIRRIRLEEFGTYSDEYSTRVLFFNCRKVGFSDGTYYHRISNKSLTSKLSLQLYDRPDTTRRVASFLEKHFFNERNVESQYYSAFEDCCFLLYEKKLLSHTDAKEAEQRIRVVYSQIDKKAVRKSVCTLTPGRAALWRPQGIIKKYVFALLTIPGWGFLRHMPFRILFSD
jgi:glycosyltransferase involved in cell wall biosynthesis